jgi:uncharacterized protein
MTDSTNGAAERLAQTIASIASKASDTDEEKHVRRVTETEDSVIVEYEKEMDGSEEDDSEADESTKELLEFCSDIKAEDGEEGTFYGYGSIFNNTDLGNDVVVSGAFTKSIARSGPKGVKLLYQHKSDMPIGVFEEIEEDEKGLKVKGRLALGTQAGREAYELIKMGALDGLSIGFRVSPKGQEYDGKAKKRYIKEVDLMEISLVTFPMNPKARVRSVKGEEVSIREWENGMRDAFALSRSEAKVAAKAVHEAFNQRDAEESKSDVAVSAINSLTNKLKHL